MANLAGYAYLISAICFIMALRGLSSPETARQGNLYGIVGMVIAVVTTIAMPSVLSYRPDPVRYRHRRCDRDGDRTEDPDDRPAAACRRLPQPCRPGGRVRRRRRLLHAAGLRDRRQPGEIAVGSLVEMALGTAIGAVTFTGSIIAFGKLQGIFRSAPVMFSGQHQLNALLGLLLVGFIVWFCATQSPTAFWAIVILSLVIGILLIIPIGGADMPVVVSMLNSYSGWAACGIGFTLANTALIVTGALVGSSGAILSYIMCKGMNRSIINVILGGFGSEGGSAAAAGGADDRPVQSGAPEDAAYFMKNAESVIIVPGYGMAVAQAQHALREMADQLKAAGVQVRYAIHPVAGRMPGHMNVLLAEANVPYDEVLELEEINRDFSSTDVAFVIGANDITNPAAKTDETSPIYGMPILDVEEAGTVYFIKRSMATGYAGVQNELFFKDNTVMLFGDAKDVCEKIVSGMD